MQLSDFDFSLPEDLIARYPLAERRASRLLHVGTDGALTDRRFAELPALLRPDDLLVFNDTRVIRARLRGRKDSGGKVEMLIERIESDRTALAHIKASKSPRAGTHIDIASRASATVLGRQADLFQLQFDRDVAALLERCGEMPLPPYLDRDAESADDERYQTVYASADGAVAAPTAGLHFDEPMLAELASAGVARAFVTLHVGAGTFQSLREDDVAANRLHSERLVVDAAAAAAIVAARQAGRRVVAVGTTTVRALESAAASGTMQPFDGESSLFIYPGYRFRAVDAMLTNFHLPQSSLLLLVSAFAGIAEMRRAYKHAVDERYRFFSYGDAMLIEAPAAG